GLTFTVCLTCPVPTGTRSLVAVDDAPAGQVVRRKLDDDPVLGKNADVVLPHLAADMSQDLVPVRQLHTEHGVGQWLDHSAFDLDGSVFLGHVLRYLTSGSLGQAHSVHPRPCDGTGPAAAPPSAEALADMKEWT